MANPAIPDSFLDEASELWDKAIAATKDDPATSYNVRMGAFSIDYVRMERSHRLLDLTMAKPSVSPAKLKAIAKSLLGRMDEAKDIRLAENDRTFLKQEWKKIADGLIALGGVTSGELEEASIPIQNRGKWGDIVDDPKAEDGKAMKLFNTHFMWCLQLSMGKIAFEPGKKYKLSARVRVDKAGEGEAFWMGVYSKGASRGRGGIEPRTADVPDGEYRWYDVLTWVPAPDEFFWMGPGRFTPDGKSPINGVYLDKIRFQRIDESK